jgi:hypothetical protein
MEAILQPITEWFLGKKEYFTAFAAMDSRLEGWLKAELIVLLNRLSQSQLIERFEREVNIPSLIGRNQIDFRVWLSGRAHLCELKALCISQAAGTPRNLKFYFRDDHVGLLKDFRKLDTLSENSISHKWVLGFVYPTPELRQWAQMLISLPETLNHWRCITNPRDFPDYFFISLWKSKAGGYG